MSAWNIRSFDGLEGLRELEPHWRRLYAAIPERGFQHAFETHVAYERHAHATAMPTKYLALQNEEQPRAICAVTQRAGRPFRRERNAWQFPLGLGNVVRDVICPNNPDVLAALIPQLRSFLTLSDQSVRWLIFDRVSPDSAVWRALQTLDPREFCVDEVSSVDVLDTQKDFESLSAALPRKFRSNLRNARTKLKQHRDVEFRRITDRDSVAEAYDRFCALEASGWKGGDGGRAILTSPELASFYREFVTTMTDDPRCEFNEFHADGRCIASLFCVKAGAEYEVFKTCYDEAFAHVSPGRLLLDWTIEWCCADRDIHSLNLVSHQDWLRTWQPTRVPLYGVYLSLHPVGRRVIVRALRLRLKHGPRIKAAIQRMRRRK